MPDLGDGITKVEIASWHVSEGSLVKEGDDVVELVTDKAAFYVASPASGILRKIHCSPGQEVAVGGLLGEIE